MKRLVNENGSIDFGIYKEKIHEVNYADYKLETPMGIPVPRPMRPALAKQFHFLGIIGPEFIIGMAVIDLKYLGSGFAYIYDRKSRKMTEYGKLRVGSSKVLIEPYPDTGKSLFASPSLNIEVDGGRIMASADDFEIRAELDMENTEALRICTRAGYRGWAYTQKTSPVPFEGSVTLKGRTTEISSPSYMALTDWTCGFMRRETYWCWASTATSLPDGKSLGLNLSCGVNETSFTENAFWLDNIMTKVDTVNFVFNRKKLSEPWRISSYDGRVELYFRPEGERKEKVAAMLISSRFSQLFGTFSGRLRSSDNEIIEIEDCPGFVEDHYAKW